jgi:hypothetical protein
VTKCDKGKSGVTKCVTVSLLVPVNRTRHTGTLPVEKCVEHYVDALMTALKCERGVDSVDDCVMCRVCFCVE